MTAGVDTALGPVVAPAQPRGLRVFLRRYARRGDGMLGAVILAVFALLAIAPDLFVGPLETVVTATGQRLAPPTDG
ncbi:MAG TPA: hypothetical protein VFV53_08990, partial [Candidatus Limnocylindrales bacterium]|nr:hypothetical protein [Candidatus Limnocylindrales bacterium]